MATFREAVATQTVARRFTQRRARELSFLR